MIQVSGMRYSAGAFHSGALDLSVSTGEYFVLLGPTGSGKTLFLQCLCGIVAAGAGSITLDGRDITALEPRKRSIGYVPQDAGLFSHLSVEGNLMFPLRVRGLSRPAARREIGGIVETLCLGPLMGRSTVGLSGGERQKVAVARALAMKPKLLLLDEPASALDAPSREHLCRELHRVQRQFGIVTIHVCHNLDEAASVADRAGVLSQGHLVQVGTIDELLYRPAEEVVARLMGNPNVFAATAARSEGVPPLRPAGIPERGPLGSPAFSVLTSGAGQFRIPEISAGEVRFAVRPEAVEVLPEGTPPQENCLPGVLERRENRGPYCRLEFSADVRMPAPNVPGRIVVHTACAEVAALAPGARCQLRFPPEAICVLGVVRSPALTAEEMAKIRAIMG